MTSTYRGVLAVDLSKWMWRPAGLLLLSWAWAQPAVADTLVKDGVATSCIVVKPIPGKALSSPPPKIC
jgi:hypothetical protein